MGPAEMFSPGPNVALDVSALLYAHTWSLLQDYQKSYE